MTAESEPITTSPVRRARSRRAGLRRAVRSRPRDRRPAAHHHAVGAPPPGPRPACGPRRRAGVPGDRPAGAHGEQQPLLPVDRRHRRGQAPGAGRHLPQGPGRVRPGHRGAERAGLRVQGRRHRRRAHPRPRRPDQAGVRLGAPPHGPPPGRAGARHPVHGRPAARHLRQLPGRGVLRVAAPGDLELPAGACARGATAASTPPCTWCTRPRPRQLLGVPDHITQLGLVPVARYTGESFGPADRGPIDEIVHIDGWSEP